MTIEVVDGGPLTTVQDPIGRRAWRHLGVPVGGAADGWSARLANRLVGNPDGAALLEMTFAATLRCTTHATISLTGGLDGTVDGLAVPRDTARLLRAGAVLRVEPGPGARGYLAVGGGIDVPLVLGSRSTELRTGFGGYAGRPLRAGDRLSIGRPGGVPMRWIGRDQADGGPIRLTVGPQAEGLLDALAAGTFTVSAQADRTGVRLEEHLPAGGETSSMGLPLGAVQVPPDGRPIVMLADRPVTGGYLVPAVVARADVGRVAQLRPGDVVRFAPVSLEEARAAWRRAEEELAALEPLGAAEDDELGWSGSHR